jgi:ATP-dependent Clp protease ATP-binding subunit ClpC
MERFSARTRRVIDIAQQEATALEHPHLGTEHLLLGLIAVDGPTRDALLGAGATADATRTKVAEAVGQRAVQRGDRDPSTRARRALDRASRLSLQRRDDAVEPEHLLIAVLDVEGRAGQVLRGLGVDVAALRSSIDAAPADAPVDHPAAAPADGVHCAVCGAGLEPGLAFRIIAGVDSEGRRKNFTVASCGTCGAAISAIPN